MINYDETGAWRLNPYPDESIDQLIGALRNMVNDPNMELDKKHPMNKQEGAGNIIEKSDLFYYVKGLIEKLEVEEKVVEEKARVFLTHCRKYGQESAKDYIEEDTNKNSLIERGKQLDVAQREANEIYERAFAARTKIQNFIRYWTELEEKTLEQEVSLEALEEVELAIKKYQKTQEVKNNAIKEKFRDLADDDILQNKYNPCPIKTLVKNELEFLAKIAGKKGINSLEEMNDALNSLKEMNDALNGLFNINTENDALNGLLNINPEIYTSVFFEGHRTNNENAEALKDLISRTDKIIEGISTKISDNDIRREDGKALGELRLYLEFSKNARVEQGQDVTTNTRASEIESIREYIPRIFRALVNKALTPSPDIEGQESILPPNQGKEQNHR